MKTHLRRPGQLRNRAGQTVGGGLVERLEPRAMLSADLALSDLSIAETSASPGAEIHTQFTYTNHGDPFEGAWNMELRLSVDSVWGNADDIVLGVERESEDLERGQSSVETESVVIPAGTDAGTYRLAIFIDSSGEIAESNEHNNIAFATGTIIVGAGGGGGGGGGGGSAIDLSASDVSGALNPGGDELTVSYAYTNAGGAFNGFFDQEFRLSFNQVWGDADDIVLGVEREIEDLFPGQSSLESESWALPAGIQPGDYFLGVLVDSSDAVTESSESNNLAWSASTLAVTGGGTSGGGGGAIDLTLRAVLANPTPRPVGEDLQVAWTIVNAGSSFTGGFDQQVRLSLDQIWGNDDDIILGTEREVEDFLPGQSSAERESFIIPAGTAAGVYFVAVAIDSSGQVPESDETNNIAFSAEPAATVGSGGGATPSALAVFGSGRLIPAGDVAPRRDDSTAFNRLRVDGRIRESEFEIHNFGHAELEINRLQIAGRNTRDFSISVAPNTTLAPGASTTVVVRFDPTRGGTRVARLVIETVGDDSTYEFKLKGKGVIPANAPDATITGRGGTEIRDDDLRPGGGDGTRFKSLELGTTLERTFTLRNDGVDPLLLATPFLRLTGPGAPAFSISLPSILSLPSGQSTTFTIRFAPTQAGKAAANVELLSNDPDEPLYNFRIVGRGI